MKHPKLFLPFDSQITFIEKIVLEYHNFGCSEIIIVLYEELYHQPWDKNVSNISSKTSIIINKHSDFGRFYSIQLGAKALQNIEQCFIQNVDNPFIDQDLLKEIYSSRVNNGYVVPMYLDNGGHPVLISNNVIKSIIEEKNIYINFKEKLKKFNRKSISVESKKLLVNINTIEDYKLHFDKELLKKVL
ncbi:MAG: NTP transferase domain-containing protein [Bacteroidetes bacterium]|nr:NTP transferase domain-containing protein [Bacteroidota bacterium]